MRTSKKFNFRIFRNPGCNHLQALNSDDMSFPYYCQELHCTHKVVDINKLFGTTKYKNRVKYFQTGEI
jgi:hypothetical protein